MKTVVVLAMHGVPPRDFPPADLAELMGLEARLPRASGAERQALQARYVELDSRVRQWPRTAENDAFHAGSLELAEELHKATECEVVVGFNEFCAPSLPRALDEAVDLGAARVIVVTPMMSRGGDHSEMEIPEAIEDARGKHPRVEFVYAWPFDLEKVAGFLAAQVAGFAD